LLTAGSTAVDQQTVRKNQLQFMANTIGGFVDDLAALAGTDQTLDSSHAASHLGIPRIRVIDMSRNPETTWASMGQFWFAIISVMWGDQ
jgi:ubiquitin